MPKRFEGERERAKTAYEHAESASNEGYKAEYKSLALKLPSLVKTNGLLATIAFLYSKINSKSNVAHKVLYEQIAKWLAHREMITLPGGSCDHFAKVLTKLSYTEIRIATNETLAYLSWLKRFAEGLIEKENDA